MGQGSVDRFMDSSTHAEWISRKEARGWVWLTKGLICDRESACRRVGLSLATVEMNGESEREKVTGNMRSRS
jgi:hypothetical protein